MDEKLVRMTLDSIIKKGIRNREAVLSALVKGASYNKMIFMYLMANDISELFMYGDIVHVPVNKFEERNAEDIERCMDRNMSVVYNDIECMQCKVTRGYNISECGDAPFWDTKLWVEINIVNDRGDNECTTMLVEASSILR